MRKLISGLLVVLLLVTAIACDPESGTVNDVTFNVSLSYKKAVEAGKDSVAYVDGASKWTYTAVKSDDGYTTGETKEETDLKDGALNLSLGYWTITVNGYDSKDKLVYTGSVKTDAITADSKVTVDVKPEAGMVKVSSDFAAAVTAATAGDTITLVKDVEVKESVTLDKNLTLDFGGKTVTLAVSDTNTENVGAFVLADADAAYTVTVKNGKITGTVTGKNDKSNAFSLNKNAALALDGVVMVVKCKRGIQVRDYSQDAKISVKNSTLKVKEGKDGVYVIATNAAVQDNDTSKGITIDISGSTLEATSVANDSCGSTALLLNVPGNYTITDSKIKGERQAAIFRGGTYSVSGSTFEYIDKENKNGKYDATSQRTNWSDGNDVPNAAIVIGNRDSSAYKYPTEVTFSGKNTLTVPAATGGKKNYQLYIYQYDGTESRKVTVEGFDESWNVNDDFNGATMKSTDKKTWYVAGEKSLEEAVSVATNGQTLKLLSDLDLSSYINGSKHGFCFEKNVTVDLNGKTITISNNGVYWEGDGLTIKNGKFKALDNNGASGSTGSYALRIGYGKIEDGQEKPNGDLSDETKMQYVATIEDVECEGGICVSSHQAIIKGNTKVHGTNYYALQSQTKGKLIVEAGTFTTDGTKCGGILLYPGTKSTIDTSVTSGDESIIGYIEIKGGTFGDSDKTNVLVNTISSTEKVERVKIVGGTFYLDPTKVEFKENEETKYVSFVADGYQAVKDESANTWTVSQIQAQ